MGSFQSRALSVCSQDKLREIKKAGQQHFLDNISMVISISYGIFIVVCSLAAYTFDLTMYWSYITNVGEVWNLALCSVGIVLLLFLCVDIRRYVNLVLDMHEGSNSVSGIKLMEGEDGDQQMQCCLVIKTIISGHLKCCILNGAVTDMIIYSKSNTWLLLE